MEGVAERGGVGLHGARHGPGLERRGEGERAVEPGGRKLLRLVAREAVEPERGGRRDQHQLGVLGRRAGVGVVVRWVDRVRPLAGQVQRPAVEPGRLAPRAEGGEEGLGPEVLVDVDHLMLIGR
jgi:hypothetical protein